MSHFRVNSWKEPQLWSLKESLEEPVSTYWLREGEPAYFRLLCLKLQLENMHLLNQTVCRALGHKINLTERIFSIIWQPVLQKWKTEMKWHVSILWSLFQSWVMLPGTCPTTVLTACQEGSLEIVFTWFNASNKLSLCSSSGLTNLSVSPIHSPFIKSTFLWCNLRDLQGNPWRLLQVWLI